jgi:hypothetical protein
MNSLVSPYNSPHPTIDSTTQALNQCRLTNAVSQMSGLGFFLLFLFISYLCSKRWSRKRYERQAIVPHQQQIERLERIWKITSDPEF